MPKKIEMPEEELQKLVQQGKTQEEIANYYGCAVITIKLRMKQYGIEPSYGKIVEPKNETLREQTELKPEKAEVIKIDSHTKVKIERAVPYAEYTIDGNSLIFYNSSGDCGIASSEMRVIKTGISLEFNGGIGVLRLLDDETRSLAIVNSVIKDSKNVLIMIANHHPIDSYILENKKPIARLEVLSLQNVSWIEV